MFSESSAIGGVSISNHEPWSRLRREGLGHLSGSSFRRRVGSDANMHQLPPLVTQDNRDEEEFERDCGDYEEIDRGRTVQMIAEKCLPSQTGILGPAGHAFGHSGLTDLESELQKFSVEPRCDPQAIVRPHLPDERLKLVSGVRPPSARSRLPAPLYPKPVTMPAHQCLRIYDTDRSGEVRPEAKDECE